MEQEKKPKAPRAKATGTRSQSVQRAADGYELAKKDMAEMVQKVCRAYVSNEMQRGRSAHAQVARKVCSQIERELAKLPTEFSTEVGKQLL